MAESRRWRYPPEYRERMVELVKAGRSPGSPAREFEPSEHTIRNRVRQPELDEGPRSDGLTTEARKQPREPKREVKRLRMERDIPENAASRFARESGSIPRRVHPFMKAYRAIFPLAAICRVPGLSPGGCHDWLQRPPSAWARGATPSSRAGSWRSGTRAARPVAARGSTRRCGRAAGV